MSLSHCMQCHCYLKTHNWCIIHLRMNFFDSCTKIKWNPEYYRVRHSRNVCVCALTVNGSSSMVSMLVSDPNIQYFVWRIRAPNAATNLHNKICPIFVYSFKTCINLSGDFIKCFGILNHATTLDIWTITCKKILLSFCLSGGK